MGRVLTVTGRLAETPYRIRRIERNVYSAEELCYSLAQCADFMDEEIMDPALAVVVLHALEGVPQTGGEGLLLVFPPELAQAPSINRDLNRAQMLAGRGHMRQAQTTYTELLEKLPDMERGTRAQIWKEKGLHYADSFLFERAADCFRQAWELSPAPEHAFWYVASLYMYMSGEEYRAFLEVHPEFYESAYQVEQRASRAESRFKSGSESRQLRRLRQLRRENQEEAFSSRLGHTLKGMQDDYRQRA